VNITKGEQNMLEQWDYTKSLSTELRDASLWLLSEGTLSWLIVNKRDTPSFLQVLVIILPRSLPSRQMEIWNMMQVQRRPDNSETVIFEEAVRTQVNDMNCEWKYISHEKKAFERLRDMIKDQRYMIQHPTLDVKSVGVQRL